MMYVVAASWLVRGLVEFSGDIIASLRQATTR